MKKFQNMDRRRYWASSNIGKGYNEKYVSD